MFVDLADGWLICYLSIYSLREQSPAMSFTWQHVQVKRVQDAHIPYICPFFSHFPKNLQDEESETPEETGKLPESVREEFFSLPRFEGSALYPCVALSNHSCILAICTDLVTRLSNTQKKVLLDDKLLFWWIKPTVFMEMCDDFCSADMEALSGYTYSKPRGML